MVRILLLIARYIESLRIVSIDDSRALNGPASETRVSGTTQDNRRDLLE
jgi:hypothetical protein